MADYKTINYPVTPAEKGQQTMEDSISVVISSDQTPIDVNAILVDPSVGTNGATAPTSSGLAGTVDVDTGNLEPANSHKAMGKNYLYVDGSGFVQPISVGSLPLPMGAATETASQNIINAVNNVNDKLHNNPYQDKLLVDAGNDVFGVATVGSKYNQIEIDFNTAPGASLITNTTASSGTITQANGQSVYYAASNTTSQAKSVSVKTLNYRPGNESYAMFSASFTNVVNAGTYQRIGLFNSTDGFYVGFEGNSFGITKRTNSVDTFVLQGNFNGDKLDGLSGSKFTRDGYPEALSYGNSNVFRIRFGWLGSASIYYEILSPDGEWVTFHTIKQPNSALTPSLTNPNLPMTIDINKNGNASGIALTMTTTCWAAGTTSQYSKITDTLTDNSLASLTRSVLTGQTTAGGGGFVNVKVNPSGALTADVTGTVAATQSGTWNINDVTGTVSLPTGAATSAKQPALGSAGTASSDVITVQGIAGMTAIAVDGSATTQPVSGTVNVNTVSGVDVSYAFGGGSGNFINIGSLDPGGNPDYLQQTSTGELKTSDNAVATQTALINTNLTSGGQKTQIVDGSGSVIASTSNALNVNIQNTSIQAKAAVNLNGSGSGAADTVSTVITLTAPSNTVGFILMNMDTSTANIRYAIGRTASATLGQQLQPGRDTGFVPCGANISLCAESGTQTYDVQWVSQ